jgi:hypothetical protein
LSKNLDSRRFTGCLKGISFFLLSFFLSLFGEKIIVVFVLLIDEVVARSLNLFCNDKSKIQQRKAQDTKLIIFYLCRFNFVLDKVKKGSPPYQIQVTNFINSINF